MDPKVVQLFAEEIGFGVQSEWPRAILSLRIMIRIDSVDVFPKHIYSR